MKVNIKIDSVSVGNPQRGYHAYETRVEFEYPPNPTSWYDAEREREIVDAILKPDGWMWYDVTKTVSHVFFVKHGFDSGD